MRELYEGHDDGCREEDSYKGDHHVLGHTISLMLVVGYLILIV
jgi:hypothetical protein